MPRAKTAKIPTNGKTTIEKISEVSHAVPDLRRKTGRS